MLSMLSTGRPPGRDEMETKLILCLHLEGCCEVLPGVVQLVAEHLHRQSLHHAGSRYQQFLVQTDPGLC